MTAEVTFFLVHDPTMFQKQLATITILRKHCEEASGSHDHGTVSCVQQVLIAAFPLWH